MTRKHARTNDAALAAFIAKKVEVDAMLARLQALGEVELAAIRAGRFLAPDLLSLSYIPMRLLCLWLSLILLLRVVVHR